MKTKKYILAILCLLTSLVSAKNIEPKTEQLSEKNSELFKYYFYDALRCYNLGQYDQALALLEYCRKINNHDAETKALLGTIYTTMLPRYPQYFFSLFEEATDDRPDVWRYRLAFANLLFTLNQEKEAIKTIREGLKYYQDDINAWGVLAYLYQYTGDYKNAIKAHNEIERINGLNRKNTINKYRLYTMMSNDKKAKQEIENYLKAMPQDYEMQCFLANIYLEEGKHALAYKIIQQTIEDHPENYYAYTSLSFYYSYMSDNEQAVKTITDALQSGQLDIINKIYLFNDNKELLEKNNVDLEKIIVQLIEREPLDADLYIEYASILHEKGDTVKLISTLQTLTDIQPKNSEVWTELINLAIETNDEPLIESTTNHALELLPNEAKWYYFKCLLLTRDKEYEQAIDVCLRGIEVASDKELNYKAGLYHNLGDLYMQFNMLEQTYDAYEHVLALTPDNDMVLNNYAYTLSTNGGDLKKAEKMSSKTIEHDPDNPTFLDTYAWILHLQGSNTLAKFYITKARNNMKPDEDSTEIEEHYKIIYQE